jgi:hypothetical protein
MNRALELLICGPTVADGLCGVFWPRLFLSSLEEQYTPRRARITGLVILLMGSAALLRFSITQAPQPNFSLFDTLR